MNGGARLIGDILQHKDLALRPLNQPAVIAQRQRRSVHDPAGYSVEIDRESLALRFFGLTLFLLLFLFRSLFFVAQPVSLPGLGVK